MILNVLLIGMKNLFQLLQNDWKHKTILNKIIFKIKKDISLQNKLINRIYKKLLKLIKKNLKFINLPHPNFIILKKFLIGKKRNFRISIIVS